MKLKRFALLLLVSAFTGWVGYYVGIMRETGATRLANGATVGLDHLASAKSFSEVEQARAALDALAVQYAENAQALMAREIMSHNPSFGIRLGSSERPMVAAIQMLDEAILEFKGTGEELRLLPLLLFALKQERLYDRWLNVYLDALYRQPTSELLSSWAEDAVVVSRAAGRESELTAGLRYVNDIPRNFTVNSRTEDSVVRVHARINSNNHESQL